MYLDAYGILFFILKILFFKYIRLHKLSALRLEKAVATHSSTLAWKIPWAEESGRLQSMGLRRVGHDWVTSLSLFTFMHWGRKWQPTPVLFPGESQGRRSLVGCHGVTQSRTRLKRLSSSSSRQHIKKQRHYFVNKGVSSVRSKKYWFGPKVRIFPLHVTEIPK